MAVLAAIGVALGASGTAAVVVGGAVVGAVAGGAIAAINGDNIFEGALKGGVIGAFGGYLGAATGIAGTAGTTGAAGAGTGGATSGSGIVQYEGAHQLAAGAGASTGGGATAGMTAGEAMVSSAALSGISGAYGDKRQQKAMTEAERIRKESEDRQLAAIRATPVEGTPQLTVQQVNAPWKSALEQGTGLGAVQAPTVAPVAPQQVGAGAVQSGFQPGIYPPKVGNA